MSRRIGLSLILVLLITAALGTRGYAVTVLPSQSGLGYKSYYQYREIPTSVPNTRVYVNLYNGNLHVSATDIALTPTNAPTSGPVIPVSFERKYNSLCYGDTYPPAVRKWATDVGRLYVGTSPWELLSDYSWVNYPANGDGTFAVPAGEGKRLVRNSSTGEYQAITKDQVTYSYDSSGYLYAIGDRYGSRVTITYQSSQPYQIKDSTATRVLTLAWESGVSAYSRIHTVTDQSGRQVHYTYNQLDQLVKVTDPAGHETAYTYDANSNLTGITDAEGHTVSFEYDSSSRVIAVTSATQNAVSDPAQRKKLRFVYDAEYPRTTTTDELGRVTDYLFDANGSAYSVAKYGQASGYIEWLTEYQWNSERQLTLVETSSGAPSEGVQTVAYSYATNTDGIPDLMTKIVDYGTGKLNLAETYTYDQYHNRTTVTDPKGSVTAVDWGTDGKSPLQVRRPAVPTPVAPETNCTMCHATPPLAQPTVDYTYNAYGQRLSESDNASSYSTAFPTNSYWQKTFTYDGAGNIQTISTQHHQDPTTQQWVWSTTTFEYDSLGRKTAEIDPRGYVTRFEWDSDDLLTAVSYPDGGRVSYTYSPTHLKLTETRKASDSVSYTTTYSYDADGRLIRTDYPDGGSLSYTYDVVGNKTEEKVKVEEAVEEFSAYEYDEHDRVTRITHPDGGAELFVYDAYGNKRVWARTQDATRDAIYSYDYDGANRLVQVLDPEGHATTYAYDQNGNKTTETNALGVATSFVYDACNRLSSVTRASGTPEASTTQYRYYLNGLKFKETDPNGYTTTFESYPNLLLQRQTNPDGGWVEYEYDLAGNKTVERVAMTATHSAVTQFAYGPTNLLTQITDARNGITQYEYDLRGKLTALVNARNYRTSYEYDSMGRLTRATDAALNYATYSYDLAGNQTQMIDRKGQVVTYGYDLMNRLTLVRPTSMVDTTYTYDYLGNKLTMTDATGTTTYTYDLDSRQTSVTDAQNRRIDYEYDPVGNRTFMTNPYDGATKKTAYTYDNLNRLKTVTDPDGKTVAFTYDPGGRKTVESLPGGAQVTYGYDAMNRKTRVTNLNALAQTISEFTYTYDLAGNQLTKVDSRGTTSYGYDDLGRLTHVTNPDLTTIDYTYDAVGNRTVLVDSTGTTTYEYNNLDQVTSSTAPSGTTTYQYDLNGNQIQMTTTAGTRTFGYNALNQQISTSGPEGDGTYAYDGTGRRITKTEGGITKQYLYDGDFILLELDGASAYTTRNLYGRDYLGRTTLIGTPDYQTFVLNGHGDVTKLLAADGTTTANSYYYDAWGNFLERTETVSNDLFYALQEYDNLTGNYHMGARYYAPGLGRFISADSWTELPDDERGYRVGGFPFHFNLYAYALDNPLKYIDPSGHREDWSDGSEQERRTSERNDAAGREARERERYSREREARETGRSIERQAREYDRYLRNGRSTYLQKRASYTSWAAYYNGLAIAAALKRNIKAADAFAAAGAYYTSMAMVETYNAYKAGFISTSEFYIGSFEESIKNLTYLGGKKPGDLINAIDTLSTLKKALTKESRRLMRPRGGRSRED